MSCLCTSVDRPTMPEIFDTAAGTMQPATAPPSRRTWPRSTLTTDNVAALKPEAERRLIQFHWATTAEQTVKQLATASSSGVL